MKEQFRVCAWKKEVEFLKNILLKFLSFIKYIFFEINVFLFFSLEFFILFLLTLVGLELSQLSPSLAFLSSNHQNYEDYPLIFMSEMLVLNIVFFIIFYRFKKFQFHKKIIFAVKVIILLLAVGVGFIYSFGTGGIYEGGEPEIREKEL